MTIDEAIQHCEDVAQENENQFNGCPMKYDGAYANNGKTAGKCANEHRQLAEWLKDYKRLLEQQPSDTVSRGAYEQVMWERDVAIGQLKELGYGLGQKVEPCDAISRQAVLDKAVYTETEEGWSGRTVDVKDIEALPPVTPQQKYGKWIKHPEIETSAPEYLMFYECSECGDKQCFCKSDIHKKRFCNNCGAKMVEPQESEEV